MTSAKQRINEESKRDPDDLEREAETARRDIAHTMDLLEQRLSPGQLLDRALSMGREHAGEFASNLGRSVKYHPVPLLLTAVGISWLALAENRPPQPGGGSGMGGMFGRAKHAGNGAVDSAREKAENLTGSMRERAENVTGSIRESANSLRAGTSEAADSLRHQGERVRERFEQTLHEQPLVLGALGLALGAILGGTLPRSQYEDRAIGEYGDRLREQAAGTAEAAQEAGARTAEAAREAATKTAREQTSQQQSAGGP